MLHANPLLRDISCDKKFITVGEIMLRLTPPNYEKLRMANQLRGILRWFGGKHCAGAGEFGHRQHVLLGCAE